MNYAELRKVGYFIIQSNTTRDRTHRLYCKTSGLRLVGSSANLKTLVAMANYDYVYVAGVQQAEG